MKRKKSNPDSVSDLRNVRVVLGICGSIAAYKSPELVRLLVGRGAEVSCILTANGARFVTPLTLQTLSRAKVYEGMFDSWDWDIEHISLAQKADIIVVAPASADMIARLAAGRADDLLSCVILAARKPVLICPAMNENMWLHPATKENVRRCVSYGYRFTQPQEGELACGVNGAGRLAELESIVAEINTTVHST